MLIDEVTYKNVAWLARIDFSRLPSGSLQAQVEQVGRLLSWVEELHQVNPRDTLPLRHPSDLPTALRDDVVVAMPGTDALLAQAPDRDQDSFLVPQVLDDSPEDC